MIFVGFGSDVIVTASEELVEDPDRGTWMHGVASVESDMPPFCEALDEFSAHGGRDVGVSTTDPAQFVTEPFMG